MMRHFPRLSLVAVALALFASGRGAPAADEIVDAAAALARLKEGNRVFVASEISSGRAHAHQRAIVAQAQRPFAIVVACADSRTTPEIVFDQGLGDLFVVRTAGNLVEDFALGSIEYAVAHLGARLVVVLGHERCGAVKAALDGGEAPGHIRALVEAIRPALPAGKGGKAASLHAAVEANATAVAKKIRQSKPALSELAHGEVKVVTASYDLDTGVVSWIE